MKSKILVSCLIVLMCPFFTFAQQVLPFVDSVVHRALDSFQVAGAAIVVVKDNRILHAKGYGIRSVETNLPVDEHTNFSIASNTKAFTTAALAILVDEGKLNWEDKVIDHIPEFRMYDPYVTAHFNIDDLITHRSGLGLGVGDLMFWPDGTDFTIDDILKSFQHFEPTSAFRTKFDYDNLLYTVAGELIYRVTGMTWETFIEERIFKPLQMDNSYTAYDGIDVIDNIATPHKTDEQGNLLPIEHTREAINGAAGGIYSNIDDLSKWLLVHLNEGRYGVQFEKRLFSEESQKEMWKIHTVLDANRNPRYQSHFKGYGLGWFLSDIKGNLLVDHSGSMPGMLSLTTMIPDLELGLVILTNTSFDGAALFASVSKTITDKYLGLEQYDWVNYYKMKMERYHAKDTVSEEVWAKAVNSKHPADLKGNVIGVYEDPWFGKMEVYEKGGDLWMKAHRSPKLTGKMYYYDANTYAIRWDYQDMNADAFAMFQLDEKGVAQTIKMKGISPNIDFSFDFHDLDLKRVLE